MPSVAVIVDPNTATGLRLAGVSEVYEYYREGGDIEISSLLDKLAMENVALIIINERIAAENREKMEEIRVRKKGVTPIIVEIPDKRGPMEKGIGEIGRVIKRAVGITIK